MANVREVDEKEVVAGKIENPICGLVMPISATDGYTEQHWLEVKRIISEAVEPKGFLLRMVSDADESGIIQRRIVQNLYENDVVVCDVSSKNPNVMFELGLRLAFDKPTVVIKDDATNYSFDTSPIEHVGYPKDLRYSHIIQFKDRLTAKVEATYNAFKNDPNYSTFLKNFGEYRTPKLMERDVSKETIILESLDELGNQIRGVRRELRLGKYVNQNATSGLAEVLVKDEIVKFLSAPSDTQFPIFISDSQEKGLIEYLESKEEIRSAVGSPGKLRKILSGYINPF